MSLALFEAPTSNRFAHQPAIGFHHGHTRKRDASEKNALAAIELVFLGTYALDLYIKRVALGHAQWRQRKWTWVKAGAIALLFVNILVSLGCDRPYLYTKSIRPVFLVEKARNVRAMLVNMLSTIADITDVAALLATHIMFFSVIAYLLFAGVTGENDGPARGGVRGDCAFAQAIHDPARERMPLHVTDTSMAWNLTAA